MDIDITSMILLHCLKIQIGKLNLVASPEAGTERRAFLKSVG
jgi:hypothetical protein